MGIIIIIKNRKGKNNKKQNKTQLRPFLSEPLHYYHYTFDSQKQIIHKKKSSGYLTSEIYTELCSINITHKEEKQKNRQNVQIVVRVANWLLIAVFPLDPAPSAPPSPPKKGSARNTQQLLAFYFTLPPAKLKHLYFFKPQLLL